MAGQALEIILSRQLSDCISVPTFITDPAGNLIFYNEPAEEVLGKQFEDTGPMPMEEWSVVFNPQTKDGVAIEPEDLPLVQTLSKRIPAQGKFWIDSLNGSKYFLSVTSFPIIDRSDNFLGAVALFWKTEKL